MLVDSLSTDKTSEIINEGIDNSKTKLFKNIYSGEMSPSSSINLGINSSEENIIAYVDCGIDIPSNWLESSLNQMNKNNSDMVSVRIFTEGENIIDKSFIAQTYGFKNNQICLPGSLIKRNVFNLIGLFLNKARASYDTDFIKKFHNHNLKQSINDKVILKYLGINYTNSLSNGARKVYSYSLDAWNAAGDKKPIIYIFLFIISLITFFLSSQIFLILMKSYLILRTILKPIYKSKKS
jgi:Glycosyl transferase family 2.